MIRNWCPQQRRVGCGRKEKNNRTIEGENRKWTGTDSEWWGVRRRTTSTCPPVKNGNRETTAMICFHTLPFSRRQHACMPGPLQNRPMQAARHGEDSNGSATHTLQIVALGLSYIFLPPCPRALQALLALPRRCSAPQKRLSRRHPHTLRTACSRWAPGPNTGPKQNMR